MGTDLPTLPPPKPAETVRSHWSGVDHDGTAVASGCGRYRYELTRRWAVGPVAVMVGLNPSTADHEVDDPTTRRCVGFAKAWGCGGLVLVNLFALRSTDPRRLRDHDDPVGAMNDRFLAAALDAAGDRPVVACWGVRGTLRGRDAEVLALFGDRPVQCFGRTRDGHPRHPLYLPNTTDLSPFLKVPTKRTCPASD